MLHWLLVTTLVTHPVQDGHQDDGGGDDDEDWDEERRGDQHDQVGEVFWFGPVRSAAEKVGHVKLGGRITKPCSEPGSATTTTCSTAVVAQVVEQRHSVQVGRVQITGPTYTFWFRFAVKSMHHSIRVVKEEPGENRLTANLNRKKPRQVCPGFCDPARSDRMPSLYHLRQRTDLFFGETNKLNPPVLNIVLSLGENLGHLNDGQLYLKSEKHWL